MTVKAIYMPLVETTYTDENGIEPYIDENGAYVLGVKEHYEFSGKNYAVNEDGSLGEELSDISLSYFEFKLNGETYQINRYTGPAINGKLIIPKTFNGKKNRAGQ